MYCNKDNKIQIQLYVLLYVQVTIASPFSHRVQNSLRRSGRGCCLSGCPGKSACQLWGAKFCVQIAFCLTKFNTVDKIEFCLSHKLLSPNPKGLGVYNLGSIHMYVRPSVHTYVRTYVRTYVVRTYVRTSLDSDFSEVYRSNSLKLYAKIRYGLRIMFVKYIFDIIRNGGLAAILNVNTLGAVTRTTPTGFLWRRGGVAAIFVL